MKILKNKTISDVPYYKAIGIHCGIKKNEKKDLCIIYSEKPAVAVGTFTQNKVKAAPVLITMKNINSINPQAIVINSGNANACTGKKGLEDALTMAKVTAESLDLLPEKVLVSSTGIIGVPLPISKIVSGIESACNLLTNSKGDGYSAAEAIMTTDSHPKKITVEIIIDNKPILISAIAKGSGMIHPNMATMLSFITTNANISKNMLSKALRESVDDSYNMISVDGDTSTNDMVLILANASAENQIIDKVDDNYFKFKEALDYVNKELAKMIAQDGEGATKLIEVSVYNARTLKDAKLCAKSVISSNLLKSAIFGSDANWGRIMCSLGYSGGNFNPEKVDITIKNSKNTIQLVENGVGVSFNENLAKNILEEKSVNIIIDLHDGEYDATAWGCDLSYEYVKINGCYRT
ncbi:bifunctional ornithine acetyltransferase/N-acetylglutamate synthase [Thermohalobacter berrensis]|uniref:Arginine biosynthesis bifunctional protein ArgJ n=1 Tax=Thermohalobacter berrensis TaxID=99594 RepID=A0A419T532_9FIRM|nr:bifunctional ornithine acetyltransferase/N-acetylglutamate synthase [Thermohalobacter berrensis]RKD32556.1 bifunctional ornithine acetyltransferase/N-acetylglutamate synthase [Thermohalobacter berrensis]